MASSVIGALRVNLGLDSAQFTRGTTQAQRRLNTMRRQFVAVAGTVAALGAALTTMALRGAADIDRIVKAARRIDGSAGAFQALELAAGEAGVSMSALANDLQTLNRELASSSAGAQRAMQRLGMSASDLLSMDADERIAAIADRINEMGMSAGEATALLRDLGVRNREMVLLMLQGGDAIRAARDDIRDYGLEIDEALGARVERARDQIGRLGIVTQYFGQRLAAEVVPALGAFAQAITDSMREGGSLRAVIDGLVNNMQLLATIAGVAVVAFGTRYVAALVAARLATMGVAGALVALRTALMRTGIGALIVGAGVLVDYLIRLRQAGASWGESLTLLGDVATSTWRGIMTSAQAIQPALAAVWHGIKADFLEMLAGLADEWRDWIQGFGVQLRALSVLPGIGGAASVAADRISAFQGGGGFRDAAGDAERDAAAASRRASGIVAVSFSQARDALARLNETLARNDDLTTESADAARELAAELDGIAGEVGGGGAAAAAAAVDELTTATEQAQTASFNLGESLAGVFSDALTGARSLNEGIKDLLSSMSRLFLNQAFTQLFDGFLPALNFGGFRADGGPVSAGRSYIVGERGPELFTPGGSGRITSNENLRAGGGGGQRVIINNYTGAPVQEQRSTGPDAEELVTLTIGRAVSKGKLDKQFGGRYGSSPQRISR